MAPFERGPESASGKSGTATILVVEAAYVSDFLRTLLVRRGYAVVCASPHTACELLRSQPTNVDVLITNNPREFADFPDVPLLYMAACPDPAAIDGFRRSLKLTKPFQPRQLFDCLNQLLP